MFYKLCIVRDLNFLSFLQFYITHRLEARLRAKLPLLAYCTEWVKSYYYCYFCVYTCIQSILIMEFFDKNWVSCTFVFFQSIIFSYNTLERAIISNGFLGRKTKSKLSYWNLFLVLANTFSQTTFFLASWINKFPLF